MGITQYVIKPLKNVLDYVNALSIRTLTIIGFSLVTIPLVLSLVISAVKVKQLSEHGSSAIYNVALLIDSNKQLQQTRIKMERFASQYVVLSDAELLIGFQTEASLLLKHLQHYTKSNHAELSVLAEKVAMQTNSIKSYLDTQTKQSLSLSKLQKEFSTLAEYNQQISTLTNELIQQQARDIKLTAEQVSFSLLNSLWIIPIIMAIAVLFIRLITTPLKQLTNAIENIEHGKFKHNIAISGSVEVEEIASALELMRKRLHALELQKSSFIRHISHELKTPLAAIREGAELLYDNSVGELTPAQKEISEIIKVSANKLQQHIEELLDFNVVLDSTSLQDTERLNLQEEVNKVLTARTLDIRRKNLSIDLSMADIALFSNAKQLNVILDNLLSNAIKYSPEDSTIELEATLNGEILKLMITDHGMGINDVMLDKIFDAFYQGPPPEDGSIKGSGLGLTIVKELMMRLDGDITLASQTRDPSFTQFTLTFPKAHAIR